jgi:hypothetical protein
VSVHGKKCGWVFKVRTEGDWIVGHIHAEPVFSAMLYDAGLI